MAARPVVLLATTLCLFATTAHAQVRSALQFYDSTATTQTARIGWQGGEGGQLYIDAPNDGTGPGITTQQGNVNVRGTVTAGGFTGPGTGLSNIPKSSINGLTIDSSDISAGAIATTHLKDRAVTDAKIDSVSWAKIQNKPSIGTGTITSVTGTGGLTSSTTSGAATVSVATNGITSAMILESTVDSTDIKANAIRSGHIKDSTITAVDLANRSVTGPKVALNTLDSTNLANGSVSTNEIAEATIAENDLGSTLAGKINGKMDRSGGTFTGSVTVNESAGGNTLNIVGTDNWPVLNFKYSPQQGNNSAFFLMNETSNAPVNFYFQAASRTASNCIAVVGSGDDYPNVSLVHYGSKAELINSKGNLELSAPVGSIIYTSRDFTTNGCITALGTSCASDRRFKKCLNPIDSSLQKLKQMQGVYYEWNKEAYPDRSFVEGRQVGVIAQDMEEILPEVVTTDKNGYKAVSYDKLTAVLIEAVKQQQAIIESLQAQVKELNERFEQLEARSAQ